MDTLDNIILGAAFYILLTKHTKLFGAVFEAINIDADVINAAVKEASGRKDA